MFKSYFVGITLKKIPFIKLMEDLEEVVRKRGLQYTVKLQNLSNLHITLFYFGNFLNEEDMLDAKRMIDESRNKASGKLSFVGTEWFLHDDSGIFFLVPETDMDIGSFHESFYERFHKEYTKDRQNYTPHMTLFRVKDLKEFRKSSKDFEDLIGSFLNYFGKLDYFDGMNQGTTSGSIRL